MQTRAAGSSGVRIQLGFQILERLVDVNMVVNVIVMLMMMMMVMPYRRHW